MLSITKHSSCILITVIIKAKKVIQIRPLFGGRLKFSNGNANSRLFCLILKYQYSIALLENISHFGYRTSYQYHLEFES